MDIDNSLFDTNPLIPPDLCTKKNKKLRLYRFFRPALESRISPVEKLNSCEFDIMVLQLPEEKMDWTM